MFVMAVNWGYRVCSESVELRQNLYGGATHREWGVSDQAGRCVPRKVYKSLNPTPRIAAYLPLSDIVFLIFDSITFFMQQSGEQYVIKPPKSL